MTKCIVHWCKNEMTNKETGYCKVHHTDYLIQELVQDGLLVEVK